MSWEDEAPDVDCRVRDAMGREGTVAEVDDEEGMARVEYDAGFEDDVPLDELTVLERP